MVFETTKRSLKTILTKPQLNELDSLDDYPEFTQQLEKMLLHTNPTVLAYLLVSLMSEMVNEVETQNQVNPGVIHRFNLCYKYLFEHSLLAHLSNDSLEVLATARNYIQRLR